jgi:hydrogenase maturation protease
MKPILIAGIGNVLLGDDGFGPRFIAALVADSNFGPDVDVEDLGTPGLELAGYLSGRRAVVLVDCIHADAPAGSIRIYNKAEILAQKVPVRSGPHEPSIVEALLALQLAGAEPEQLTLIGVVGQSFHFGETLSQPLRAAIEPARAALCSQMATLAQPCKASPGSSF